jgi:drug/metabolite transporter (DMT)-like permease
MVTAVSPAPLAQIFGALLVGARVAALIACMVLGERPGGRTRLALAADPAGVALVTEPRAGVAGPGLARALAGGAVFGAFLAATRAAAAFAPPLASLVGQLVAGSLLLAPLGLHRVVDIPQSALLPLVLSAAASAAGNLLTVAALSKVPAALLDPFVYVQRPSALLIGGIAHGERPTSAGWLGLCMIVTAGLLAARAGRREP